MMDPAIGPSSLQITKLLHTYGPALISKFRVHDDFVAGPLSHIGLPVSGATEVRTHAMVLIGYRKVGEDFRFLVQNSWSSKPFFEVDAVYLGGCDAVLTFVRTPQTHVLAQFDVNDAAHVECEADVGEQADPDDA